MISRRTFIVRGAAVGAAAAAAGAAGPALAIGDGSKLKIAQLRYAGNWDPRPRAPLVLAQEIRFRTSVDVRLQRAEIEPDSPGMFHYPFMIMLGDGRVRFSAKKRASLKKWIEAGGFLFIDNCGQMEPSKTFDASVRSELAGMFPGRDLQKIPPTHVLFRTFYVLDFPAGRAIHATWLEGLFLEDRLAVVYSQNDLTGALDRDRVGVWRYDVTPGGETQREKAIRMGINLVQYSMCLDYKDDQVHLDWLLHKRRWRIKPPVIKAP